jgi:alginate O-acetyltransferase complex protein AlgI
VYLPAVVFSSPLFLFLFLPAVLALYTVAPWRLRNAVLLVSSLLFYAWGETEYVAVMLLSILANFGFAVWIGRNRGTSRAKLALALSIAFDLGLLVWFKYAIWGFRNVEALLGALGADPSMLGQEPKIHLPLGISFYTFHAMSAVIDVYRGDARTPRKLLDFGLYIACFPQLVAGPIIRYEDVADQIEHRRVTFEGFALGVRRFVIGLGKKVLLANTIALAVDEVFAVPAGLLSPGAARLALFGYALQIYFDFSGYSDMAIGLGRLFGFVYRENFEHPYVSTSITEFWRRWHISLSTWFKNYLYVPLGGNRRSPARTYLNLVVVFLLVGLWHGAAWQFVAFGAFHGSMMILERAGLGRVLEALPVLARRLYFGAAVLVGWSFFRAESVPQALSLVATAASPLGAGASAYTAAVFLDRARVLALAIGFVLAFPWAGAIDRWRATRASPALASGFELATGALLLLVLAGSLLSVSSGAYNPFIYFRF